MMQSAEACAGHRAFEAPFMFTISSVLASDARVAGGRRKSVTVLNPAMSSWCENADGRPDKGFRA